ncbi:hypothetical protein ACJRO7_006789 [Eucalyptus globulus]|uniref:PGG domain-containing protein n=1 Tax=Eucalyptus globulus TaxID=34317 RepID=A0ABD3IK08_EUCGL
MLTQDSVSCDETTAQELFTAAKQGDVDAFIRVVERYCSERNLRLCLRVILSPSRNSLLHVAAGLERDEILRAIVNHFPDQLVAGENCRGDTVLHLAARAGTWHISGCNMRRTLVQVKNKRGNTPLHEAVVSGHLDVVRILIGEDLQPTHWENKEGECPVSLAVERGNLEVLRLLLAGPLDLSRIEGVSPVHAAVLHGKLDMLQEISERNPDLFGLKDDRGGTPLHLAAYIEKFTSSRVEYNRDEHFPIHVACKQGHVQAIKELVRQWPDPMELINQHAQNLLHVCTMQGRIEARLPSIILKSAVAPSSKDLAMCKPWDKEILAETAIQALQKGGALKNLVNIRLVVAILVVTVTFAAGFSILGGYDSPKADARLAQMLNRSMFHALVICNTVAMYCAISVVLVWPWTQLDDSYVALSAHTVAMLALLVSLGTMSVAFMAGSYVIVSKLTWLGSLSLLLGAGALVCICLLSLALYVTALMNQRCLRSIAFYIICLGIVLDHPDVMEHDDSRPAGMKGTRTMVASSLSCPGTLPEQTGY